MANELSKVVDRLGDEFTTLQKEYEKAQEAYRKDASKRDALSEVQKRLAVKANEVAEVARTAALVAGGKNYMPQP